MADQQTNLLTGVGARVAYASKNILKTIPAKTQSYMAFGKPILTNADGEVSRIINESNSGFTADSGNHVLLGENMLKLSKLSDIESEKMIYKNS